MSENLTYQEFINNILQTRGRFNCGDEYHERHHIVPKCLGGTNEENNLIDLFGREHYIAHKLLAKENPKIKELQFAFWMMSRYTVIQGVERYVPTPEEYEMAKIAFSESMRGENNPMRKHIFTEDERAELSKRAIRIFSGRKKTEETKRKISESNKNKPKSEAHKQSLRDARKRYFENGGVSSTFGTHPSEETRMKQRLAKLGKKSPVCKKVVCLETNTVYESIVEAHCKTGLGEEAIRRSCKKLSRTKSGFSFRYYREEEDFGTQ